MSVTTRTNRATNPAAAVNTTNWAAVAGTGGTAAMAWNSGAGLLRDGFARVTWSAATTSISGGLTYTEPSGIPANTAQAFQVWVVSSKTQRLQLSATFKTSGGSTVNTITGAAVVVQAGVVTPVQVQGTSGASVTQVVLTVQAVSGTSGSNWASGDKLDGLGVLLDTGTTYGDYFDGATPDGGGVVYAWTGPDDASTSTAVTYVPTITAVPVTTDDPCPRVEVTIADLDPYDDVVNVWRTADGNRTAVRGARRWTIVGSDAVIDYEAPIGRPITYELEVLSGISAQAVATPVTVQLDSDTGWIQDPLDPGSAIPLYGEVGPNGEPALRADAVKALEYAADISLIPILGQEAPVALIGQRLAAGNVDFHMVTDAAQQSTLLRDLLKQAAPLLIRPLPEWAGALPGLCYVAIGKPRELPINEAWGGSLIEWELTGDLVAAPSLQIVVAVFTYGDVAGLWSTYQQAQSTYSGNSRTYLDVKKSPSN